MAESHGFDYVEMGSYGGGYMHITYYYSGLYDELSEEAFADALFWSTLTLADTVVIVDNMGTEFSVETEYVRQFYEGVLSQDELSACYNLYDGAA